LSEYDDENPIISASMLAQLGSCEKQAHLSFIHGKRIPEFRQKLMDKGTIAHEQNRNRVLSEKKTDKRCFIATEIYGPNAPQTIALRTFRDQQLLPNPLGKIFVKLYYIYSPFIVKIISKFSFTRSLIRGGLDYLLKGKTF